MLSKTPFKSLDKAEEVRKDLWVVLREFSKSGSFEMSSWYMVFIIPISIIIFTIGRYIGVGVDKAAFNAWYGVLMGVFVSILVTTYSITAIVIQIASGQFSPRIIRIFQKDRVLQLFFASILFTVGAVFVTEVLSNFLGENLPDNCWRQLILGYLICMSLVSAAISLLILPMLLHYIGDVVNVASICKKIYINTSHQIALLFTETATLNYVPKLREELGLSEGRHIEILSDDIGYLQTINYKKLIKEAQRIAERLSAQTGQRCHLSLYQKPLMGNFIDKQDTVFKVLVHNEQGNLIKDILLLPKEKIKLEACCQISKYRNFEQDFHFGLRQLVDIAIKAISPAVNDPTTAINCLHYLSAILRFTASRAMTNKVWASSQAVLHIPDADFDIAVDLAFDQIYFWGKSDPIIVRSVLKSLYHVMHETQSVYYIYVLLRQFESLDVPRLMKTENFSLEAIEGISEELRKIDTFALGFAKGFDSASWLSNTSTKNSDISHSVHKYFNDIQKNGSLWVGSNE